jgi:integrase
LTFAAAAEAYMKANGDHKRLLPIIRHFGTKLASEIDQIAIINAAEVLKPQGSPATRNREVYTPISAVLKLAGCEFKIRRPKGWRGMEETNYLQEHEAFAAFAAADLVDREFGIFLRVLCYTGMRLSEGTRGAPLSRMVFAVCSDPKSQAFGRLEGKIMVSKTKNGTPRAVYLPPHIVSALEAHPRGLDRKGETLFRFRKNGRLYKLLKRVEEKCGIDLGFHLFRHTFGQWMTEAGADTTALVATGTWKDAASARRYQHLNPPKEARRALLLPVPPQTDVLRQHTENENGHGDAETREQSGSEVLSA